MAYDMHVSASPVRLIMQRGTHARLAARILPYDRHDTRHYTISMLVPN